MVFVSCCVVMWCVVCFSCGVCVFVCGLWCVCFVFVFVCVCVCVCVMYVYGVCFFFVSSSETENVKFLVFALRIASNYTNLL